MFSKTQNLSKNDKKIPKFYQKKIDKNLTKNHEKCEKIEKNTKNGKNGQKPQKPQKPEKWQKKDFARPKSGPKVL